MQIFVVSDSTRARARRDHQKTHHTHNTNNYVRVSWCISFFVYFLKYDIQFFCKKNLLNFALAFGSGDSFLSLSTVGWFVGIGISSIVVAAWYFQDNLLYIPSLPQMPKDVMITPRDFGWQSPVRASHFASVLACDAFVCCDARQRRPAAMAQFAHTTRHTSSRNTNRFGSPSR